MTNAEKRAAAASLPTLYIRLMEELAIRRALEEADQNRTHAAKVLGITVRTLQRTILSLGLPKPQR